MIELAPSDDGRGHVQTSRRLWQSAENVDERYRPLLLSPAEVKAVVVELICRGLADYYVRRADMPAAAE